MSTEILLSEIERDQRYEVVGFKGDKTEYEAKLHRLGFVEGTEVSLVPAQRRDPMIVRIRGSRIALRTTEAGCVIVKRRKEVLNERLQKHCCRRNSKLR